MGMDNPNAKTGRWSKMLPAQLAARYDELVKDGEIINLGHDIALLDVRMGELLERLDTKESEVTWARARTTFADLRAALTSGNTTAIREAMRGLNDVLNAQVGIDQTWRDIRDAMQERRLLVESERRRLVDMHQMVTVEEVLLLVTAITGIVQRNVPDVDSRRRIAGEIQALLGQGGRIAAQALRSRNRAPAVRPAPQTVPSEVRDAE